MSCVSLHKGRTNPLDSLETPTNTAEALGTVYALIQPDNRQQRENRGGGGDRVAAERERADRENERRNQVSKPGRPTDRRAGSEDRQSRGGELDFEEKP